jgi:hypothetical protein
MSIYPSAKRRLLAGLSPEPNSGCWLWTGYIRPHNAYGAIWAEGRSQQVHRLAYALFKGPIPDNLCVLHKCDTRLCANPDHLFLGTQTDNMRDCWLKGRHTGQILMRLERCRRCGNEKTKENTVIRRSGRAECIPCRNADNMKYRARRKSRSAL